MAVCQADTEGFKSPMLNQSKATITKAWLGVVRTVTTYYVSPYHNFISTESTSLALLLFEYHPGQAVVQVKHTRRQHLNSVSHGSGLVLVVIIFPSIVLKCLEERKEIKTLGM